MRNRHAGRRAHIAGIALAWAAAGASGAAADQVIPDDVIAQSSLCVGFDCVNNESFGFDTIILKENNLRILFNDTSVGAFAANDWRIIANDSGSGAASHFTIEDATAARRLLTLSAGARANSIFLSSSSRVGFGTSNPVLDLHVKTSNTPGLRFEQDNSGGFTAQTWDVAGNEANFFIRDVTSGSKLPFRIRPGAPTSSIDINAAGDVGVGTASPAARLHVASSADVAIRLNSTAGTGGTWSFGTTAAAGELKVQDIVSGTTPLVIQKGALSDSITVSPEGRVGIGVAAASHKLHVVGGVRFASLASCTAGIQTNANGVLSCLPPPDARQAAVGSAGGVPVKVALRSGGGTGVVAATAGARGAAGGGSDPAEDDAAPCTPEALAGAWSLLATNIEAIGAGSALWCDATLVPISGQAARFEIGGSCRSHAAGEQSVLSYTLGGEGAIVDPGRCKFGGRLQIKPENGLATSATILEGSVESAVGRRTRAVAISRWAKGRNTALQTITLQR